MEGNTEIIFIRHGETDFNKAKLYFGHSDPPLNEMGRKQMAETARLLAERERDIGIVFSSDLKRCTESLEILDLEKDIEKILTEDFREINFGIFEGKTYEQIKEEYPEEVEKMRNGWRNFKADGGESISEVMERVVNKLTEIIGLNRDRKILVVTHSGVIQSVLSYYLSGNLDGYWKFKVDNGSMTKLCISGDGYAYFGYVNLT